MLVVADIAGELRLHGFDFRFIPIPEGVITPMDSERFTLNPDQPRGEFGMIVAQNAYLTQVRVKTD